jgi:hypothetical protein
MILEIYFQKFLQLLLQTKKIMLAREIFTNIEPLFDIGDDNDHKVCEIKESMLRSLPTQSLGKAPGVPPWRFSWRKKKTRRESSETVPSNDPFVLID